MLASQFNMVYLTGCCLNKSKFAYGDAQVDWFALVSSGNNLFLVNIAKSEMYVVSWWQKQVNELFLPIQYSEVQSPDMKWKSREVWHVFS